MAWFFLRMEPAEQQRKKRIGSLLPSDSRDLAPGLGPRVTCTAWPIGGRDSLPSPSHLRKPQRLTGPAARWVALPGALQPLLLQCSQESFCGIQFRFQLCDLQEWFTDSCRHLVRSPQPLYFSQPNTRGQNWLTPGHPLGRGSSSHCGLFFPLFLPTNQDQVFCFLKNTSSTREKSKHQKSL